MKKIPEKLQRLSQRAAEIRQTIESVPPIISGLRDTVATATANVQKLRADLINSVATLRAETDGQLLTTLREIDGAGEVLAEAGCRLERAELDLGPARRLVVHLERVENVDSNNLRTLLVRQTERPAVQALLRALIKADELADSVELAHLRPTQFTVEIGLIPTVRIGWSPAPLEDEAKSSAGDVPASDAQPSPRSETAASAIPVASSSQSAFFQRRTDRPGATKTDPSKEARRDLVGLLAAEVKRRDAPVSAREQGKPDDWRRTALDRFKKMPDLTKRSS